MSTTYIELPEDFEERYEEYRRKFETPKTEEAKVTEKPSNASQSPENFSILIRDREIRVNDYLLSKPHGAGTNMAFFEHVFQNSGKELQRENMPQHVQSDLGGKSFTKIVNELGFQGEILKAFVPKRGKSFLVFRKEVSRDQLEKEGVRVPLMVQELVVSHMRNSPE